MPVRRVGGGYRWGNSGKVYPTKAQAERQGRAIFASRYQAGGPTQSDNSKLNTTPGLLQHLAQRRYESEILRDRHRLAARELVTPTPAQAAYIAAQFDPTIITGIAEMTTGYPSYPSDKVPLKDFLSGELMPNVTENLREGKYGIAALQSLSMIPGIGIVARGGKAGLRASREGIAAIRQAKAASDAARASRMAEIERIQRAREMGFDVDTRVFHGTTHEIEAFDLKGTPESYFGDSIYFTDSPVDASKNYAGVGPDLKSRIFRRQEQLINDWEMADFKGASKYGKDLNIKPEDFDDMDQYFMAIARKELSGGADNVIPAYLKMENPIDLTKKNKGWELITEYDEAGDFISETGNALELHESVMDVARKYNFNGQEVFNDLDLYDFKSFREVDDALRRSNELLDVTDNSGNLVSNQAIKEIYEGAGFDGVIMDATSTFPVMFPKNVSGEFLDDIPSTVKHFIVFEPNQVRSTFAHFDPGMAYLPDISKAKGGPI